MIMIHNAETPGFQKPPPRVVSVAPLKVPARNPTSSNCAMCSLPLASPPKYVTSCCGTLRLPGLNAMTDGIPRQERVRCVRQLAPPSREGGRLSSKVCRVLGCADITVLRLRGLVRICSVHLTSILANRAHPYSFPWSVNLIGAQMVVRKRGCVWLWSAFEAVLEAPNPTQTSAETK